MAPLVVHLRGCWTINEWILLFAIQLRLIKSHKCVKLCLFLMNVHFYVLAAKNRQSWKSALTRFFDSQLAALRLSGQRAPRERFGVAWWWRTRLFFSRISVLKERVSRSERGGLGFWVLRVFLWNEMWIKRIYEIDIWRDFLQEGKFEKQLWSWFWWVYGKLGLINKI